MPTRRGKRKPAPAIVPRFLKSAVTIGVIPAIAACSKPQRMQPVVAYMAAPAAHEDAAATPNPPVVAAYQPPPPPPPVVAAMAVDAQPVAPPVDAGVDAAPAKKKAKPDKAKADKLKRPPPPVVAAMMPRNNE